MSYDISLGVKVHGTDDLFVTIATPEFDNPTYNVGKIIRACTGWNFIQGEWYKVSDVLPKIERGIHEMRFNESSYKNMEPENGWGSTQTVLNALESLIECIQQTTNGWSNNIPIEHLYVRW